MPADLVAMPPWRRWPPSPRWPPTGADARPPAASTPSTSATSSAAPAAADHLNQRRQPDHGTGALEWRWGSQSGLLPRMDQGLGGVVLR
jgi:hypothetical protein